MKNPYTRLFDEGEAGNLPPNLIIQKNPHRFTGKGEHRLDQVGISLLFVMNWCLGIEIYENL